MLMVLACVWRRRRSVVVVFFSFFCWVCLFNLYNFFALLVLSFFFHTLFPFVLRTCMNLLHMSFTCCLSLSLSFSFCCTLKLCDYLRFFCLSFYTYFSRTFISSICFCFGINPGCFVFIIRKRVIYFLSLDSLMLHSASCKQIRIKQFCVVCFTYFLLFFALCVHLLTCLIFMSGFVFVWFF